MNFKKSIARFLTVAAFSTIAAQSAVAATVHQNQIGFLTKGLKQIAVVGAEGMEVTFKDASGSKALSVKVPAAAPWTPAGDTAASLVDFSELSKAGTYQAYIGDEAVGYPIIVSDNAYEAIGKAALKFFYFQRSSTELTEEFAGKYARAAGHPDTAVRYHESTGIIDNISTFNGAKGWYDAGDYGKYIVNSGITTYTLLQLYRLNEDYFKSLNLNIPESKNDVPDILDEIRWNLEWMLTMQDVDGGIFHKLTTKNFCGEIMPEKDKSVRFAIGKSITATWNFVAVMALAADIYKPYDEAFAEKCVRAAEKAYYWGTLNPNAKFVQPSGVGTGTYSDNSATDERIWAAAELFRISKNETIKAKFQEVPLFHSRTSLPTWSTTFMLTSYTVSTNPTIFDKADVDSARIQVLGLGDKIVDLLNDNGYGVAMDGKDFNWGSNSFAANKGMALIYSYILTKEQKYLDAAVGLLDYLMGRNPLDMSYLTGYGVNQVMHPHHRPSTADTVEAPVPGMLSGGPNPAATDIKSCGNVDYRDESAPAKSFYDNKCSYASNEVAINWNAPFAFLANGLQAISSTGKVFDVEKASAANFEVSSIARKREISPKNTVGSQLIVRKGSVNIKKTDVNGSTRYFNLKGRQIR